MSALLVCVCAYLCKYVLGCMCVGVSEPEVDVGYLSEAFQMVRLDSQETLGIGKYLPSPALGLQIHCFIFSMGAEDQTGILRCAR